MLFLNMVCLTVALAYAVVVTLNLNPRPHIVQFDDGHGPHHVINIQGVQLRLRSL
jgi:hypothetical protein